MFDFAKSEKLKPTELEAFEPTETKSFIYKFATEISAEVAEKQEELILTTIQQIDGGEFIHITIDKDKVIEALTDYVNKQKGIPNIEKHGEWVKENGIYVCSECSYTCPYDVVGDNIEYWECLYCRHCGAKMDGGKDENV